MFFTLPFPHIDPVLIEIGPLVIRWYALAYLASLLIGWQFVVQLNTRVMQVTTRETIDDLLVWVTLGVILGGRIGYVLFYNAAHYLHNPLNALAVWQGGMSFHGGLLGVILALFLFARRRKISIYKIADLISPAIPIGLFFGRLANFINGELFGRPTDVPWAMVFPGGGPAPRHPSQLYEAALEGLALFILLLAAVFLWRLYRQPGRITGLFLIGYGLARIIAELFREPDSHISFLAGGTTMGQWLSIPMVLFGLYLIWQGPKRHARAMQSLKK